MKNQQFARGVPRRLQLLLRMTLSVIVLSAVTFSSCKPLNTWWREFAPKEPSKVQSETATVSHAFAYARYVAMNLGGIPNGSLWNDESIRNELIKRSADSGVSPLESLKYFAVQSVSSAIGATAQRIDEFAAQHKSCSESVSGTPRSCCEALAWPMAVLPAWEQMSEEQRQRLNKSVSTTSSQDAFFEILDRLDDAPVPLPFRTQGLKAWLSVCHALVTEQPETLQQFKSSQWFRNAQSQGQWSKVLHAKSRAKRMPRRIYKRADGVVSLAETLRPQDCSVLESEIIIRRPDGALNFWVYDAHGRRVATSHFPPAGPSDGVAEQTIEKPSPDSCMGCHYNLKTREFNIMFPSAEVLNLPSTHSLPLLCRGADDELAEDN